MKDEIVYGPVSSWRFGKSLGIDPLCAKGKICSYDCTYCSLGRTTKQIIERKRFIGPGDLRLALQHAMTHVRPEVITFSGTGEPTLAKNLAKLIEVVRELSDLPVAILSNSSLVFMRSVRKDLLEADVVKGKLDAPSREVWMKVNRPHKRLNFFEILRGLKKFRSDFNGRFVIEVMFVAENVDCAPEIAELLRELEPDEVQINTPLRPSSAKALEKRELCRVRGYFKGMKHVWVYGKCKRTFIRRMVGKEKIKRLKRLV